ncbi:MAG: xanthine dehydrogenase [Betaproteobacteria bacterium TMED156]|nr:MAG: xanthine dehydrogenase [Betaproteobacteria bacterium TMED156]
MSNHFSCLLNTWFNSKDTTQWVLGTVFKTEGSAYRKPGSFMLINGLGQQYGLLSGGCLESDIVLNSKKVMQTTETISLVYDSNDEDDLAFQYGLGCGGKVYIMLQLITSNNDLDLSEILKAMENRQEGVYHQKISSNKSFFQICDSSIVKTSKIEKREDGDWLISKITPLPHLLIVGGGIDSRPVVKIAKELGWLITVVDPRIANARKEHFPNADFILRKLDDEFSEHVIKKKVDAIFIMSHSLSIDANCLHKIQSHNLKFVSMLGPKHRLSEVVKIAGLTKGLLRHPISSPAGLDIGGQLPESIALSMLAECHGVLEKRIEPSEN